MTILLDSFIQLDLQISGYLPDFDRFANYWNTKCACSIVCRIAWIDAFDYPQGRQAKNWLFSTVRLIKPAIVHLEKSKGTRFW